MLNSSTANINGTKFNGSTNRAINFTGLEDGLYRLNVSVFDLANNSNASEQRTFTIDTTKPLITYELNGLHSITNNTYLNTSVLRINVSYTETNFANVTYNLLNSSTANINGTLGTVNTNRAINFSSLADGIYRTNVSVFDLANNSNASEQRTFTVDTTKPLTNYSAGTVGNNTLQANTTFSVNFSASDTNYGNTTN